MGRDEKARKQMKRVRKGKKMLNDTVENREVEG